MNADGGSRALFRDNSYYTEACSKFVLVWQDLRQLWRVDSDGTHLTLLPTGDRESDPVCSAKDDFAFYVSAESPERIFRIPMSGGTPVEIARTLGDGLSSPLAVSRDGELLAYAFWKGAPQPGVSFATLRAKDGSQVALIHAT